MNAEKKILEMLENSDSAVSGEYLASAIGISRSAVWKSVNSLRKAGYKITASTNRGYSLAADNTAVCAAGIKKYLKNDNGIDVSVFKTVPSTNTLAKKAAEAGGREKSVIIAEAQTAGRGRLGRSFFSPNGSGIYMSIILRPSISFADTPLITTAAAVAVCLAIEQTFSLSPKIKWVNDIFLNGKKICGILTEGAVDIESGKFDYAVLGIGINLTAPKGGFPEELQAIADGLLRKCNSQDKSRLIAAVIDCFFNIYEDISSRRFLDDYRARSLILGKTVRFIKNNEEYCGTALSIDDNAALTVKLPRGDNLCLCAGEVSVRL